MRIKLSVLSVAFVLALVLLTTAALPVSADQFPLSRPTIIGQVVEWGLQSAEVPLWNDHIVAVSAGSFHNLLLSLNGAVVGWGDDLNHECDVPFPNQYFVAIAAGYGHSMGLKADGTVACWGANTNEQCDVPFPNQDFVAIAAGYCHSMGLKADGTVVCWGFRDINNVEPPAIFPNIGYKAIADSEKYCMALTQDGAVVILPDPYNPGLPDPNSDFVAISAGTYHAMGLKSDGTVVCWGGANSNGELDVPYPNQDFVAIAAGCDYSMGLKSDGKVVVWGDNSLGQWNVPQPNSGFVAISASQFWCLGLRATPLVAEAGGPYTGYEGSPITLNGSHSSPGTYGWDDFIVSYQWDLDGDGQFDDADGPSPIIYYTWYDDYPPNWADLWPPLYLRVTDNWGETSIDYAHIKVLNVAPTVEAGPVTIIDEGGSFAYLGSFTDPGTLDGPWTATVDYGDGTGVQTLTLNDDKTFSLSHVYTQNTHFFLLYGVTVNVTDKDGATGTDITGVSVLNVAPIVEAGPSAIIDEGDTFTGSGSFSDPGTADGPWTATVDYGDGTAVSSLPLNTDKTFSLSHVYTDKNVYTVTVKVTDKDVATGADIAYVTVNNVAPTVEAGPDTTINEGSVFTYLGSFSDPGTLDGHWTATVDYGDGTAVSSLPLNTDQTFSLSRVYSDNGSYTVTVKVTDKYGATGTDSATITVNNVAPTVEAGPDAIINEGVTFTGSGSFTDPGILDAPWTATVDYGDGTAVSSLPLNPDKTFSLSHPYADNKAYTVTVTVTDKDGATGADTATVTVNNVAPTARIVSVTKPDPLLPKVHTVTFNGSFSDPGLNDAPTAKWDFGDGTSTASGTLVQHIYSASGNFTVTLTVKDKDGATGTATTLVKVASATEYSTAMNTVIQALPTSAFSLLPGAWLSKSVLSTELGIVNFAIQQKRYGAAILELQYMRSQMDGSLTPKNPFDDIGDLITNAAAQQALCRMIDDEIAYLRTLQ